MPVLPLIVNVFVFKWIIHVFPTAQTIQCKINLLKIRNYHNSKNLINQIPGNQNAGTIELLLSGLIEIVPYLENQIFR